MKGTEGGGRGEGRRERRGEEGGEEEMTEERWGKGEWREEKNEKVGKPSATLAKYTVHIMAPPLPAVTVWPFGRP